MTVGYAFIGQKVTFTPYIGFSEAHLVNQSYSETGAGLADLAIGTTTTDTFRHDIGVKMDGIWESSLGQLLPSLKIGWGHTYDNGPVAISGTLASVTFASASARPSADGALIGGHHLAEGQRLEDRPRIPGRPAQGLPEQHRRHQGDVELRGAPCAQTPGRPWSRRMDLICYLHPAWRPYLRPAPATRPWMDATPEAFAYRCLPLNIANAHGWELLNPHGFEAEWDGGTGVGAVAIHPDPNPPEVGMAVSLFGQGVLTFHVEGLFRTPRGWNLWIGGSPNRGKDGIAPLTGVVETDWSPFTFTMNWRFTRPGAKVRFEAMEPFGFVFPLVRSAVGAFKPRFEPLEANPELAGQFGEWSRSRDDFHQRMREDPGLVPSARWQKHYYRGRDVSGQALAEDHMAKLRLKPFEAERTPQVPDTPRDDADLPSPPTPASAAELAQRRREWVMEALERQRALSSALIAIERRESLTGHEFLERYYAPGRPALLAGEMAGWPALTRWNADYLNERAGRPEALAPDIGPLDKFLENTPDARHAIGIHPAGAFEPLRQGLENTLTAQIVGRRRIYLLPPSESGRLYEDEAGSSRVRDLEGDTSGFPQLSGARAYQVDLVAGDILHVPLGWWRQDRALDDNVAITYANFRWPNGGETAFPSA